ncbi:hypothetical protein EV424DRAFT_1312724 [Suillus variegatus]|nr:hypothetical protein EV424DRAFT_1312724 [Suillus variegatus]
MSVSDFTCVCKRAFTSQNHYSQHQRSCAQTKKCLSSALSSFKDFITRKKRPRVSLAPDEQPVAIGAPNALSACHANETLGGEASQLEEPVSLHNPSQDSVDVLRDPRSVFRTPPNVFGLVRQYFCAMPPSHDPEEYMTIADLSFIPEAPQELHASNNHSLYHPYPNCSFFQLGDWYWNQGLQKSQADYMKLLDIIGTSSFSASDVTSTRWKNINSTLGANEYDEGDGDEWQDKDAGWKKTLVSIKVPFSHTTEKPGPRMYEAAHLYHRSLVAVLREKLSNP